MEQTIMINALPVRTWNRLKVNEAAVQWDDEGTLALPRACYTAEAGERLEPLRLELAAGEAAYSRKEISATARAGSQMTIFERCAPKATLAASLALTLEENARVRLVRLMAPEDGALLRHEIRAVCGPKARLELVTVLLGDGDLYEDVRTELKGDGSGFDAQIAYLGRNAQRIDLNLVVDQYGKETASNIVANGALMEAAEKTFRGSIDFKRGSSGSVGSESETVLMLGQDAVNKTVPLILCAEENVEGTHGATIGELDADTLFYFQSRSFDRAQAEAILARAAVERLARLPADEAFAGAVLETLDRVLGEAEQ